MDRSRKAPKGYFCINCNSTDDCSKIFKMFRTGQSFSEDIVQDGNAISLQIDLVKAISVVFNFNDQSFLQDLPGDKQFFICEKCGTFLEQAYNAILDFVALTNHNGILHGKLTTQLVQNKGASFVMPRRKGKLKQKSGTPSTSMSKKETFSALLRSQKLKMNNRNKVQSRRIFDKAGNTTTNIPTERKGSGSAPANQVKTINCNKCLKTFDSKMLLAKHQRLLPNCEKRDVNAEQTDDDLKIFLQDPNHLALKREEGQSETLSDLINLPRSPIYSCALCKVEFNKIDSLHNHLRTHKDGEETEIKESNVHSEVLIADDSISEDVPHRKFSADKLKCKLCEKDTVYCTIGKLRNHFVKEHPLVSLLTGDEFYKIEPQKSINKEVDKEHVTVISKCENLNKKSTGNKGRLIFNCNVCNKQFSRHDHIKLHLNIHTGEKPFTCKWEGCEKSFGDPRGLAYHEITHSNERPYCCKCCGRTFKRLHHLKDHERNHSDVTRPFSCQFCHKAFKHRKHLNSHLITHEGTKEHQCSFCFKSFNRKDNLRQHVKNVHERDSNGGVENIKSGSSIVKLGGENKVVSTRSSTEATVTFVASSIQQPITFQTPNSSKAISPVDGIIARSESSNAASCKIDLPLPTSASSSSADQLVAYTAKRPIINQSTGPIIPPTFVVPDVEQTSVVDPKFVYLHL